jgi:hypothetical protein
MANQDISINIGLGGGLFGSAANLFVDVSGRYWRRQGVTNSFRTVQKAVDASRAGTVIYIAPGQYDEAVTIPRTHGGNLTLVGIGGRGSVYIETETTNGVALTNHADDVTLVNVGCDGDGSGAGLINSGARFRAKGCKIEGDDIALQLLVATVAQRTAGTRGTCGDVLFEDCESAWATTGVLFTGSDYGAVTQARFVDCRHHNHSAASFEESHVAGGANTEHFRNLEMVRPTFGLMEDGTVPTKILSLNDSNSNTGFIADGIFPTAINSGKNLVSTGLIWTGNRHTGGIAAAQPS